MNTFILHRHDGNKTIIMGAYTSQVVANDTRDKWILKFVDDANGQRDADYLAGLSTDAAVLIIDVETQFVITEVEIDGTVPKGKK
mgnify:CR=1 FL=1